MKFVKGMMIGTLISAGAIMWYTDSINMNKKKMVKKGKQFAKKMGMI